jgi:nitric oxide reductase activation protein
MLICKIKLNKRVDKCRVVRQILCLPAINSERITMKERPTRADAVTLLLDAVAIMTKKIDDMETKIDEMEHDINTLHGNIRFLKNNHNRLEREFILVGDEKKEGK